MCLEQWFNITPEWHSRALGAVKGVPSGCVCRSGFVLAEPNQRSHMGQSGLLDLQRLFQPLHLCPVWWALQPAVLFPKCCVEEGITSWLWWMWVARGMLLQRSVKLKSWILVILWNVLLLGTGRQTEKRSSQRKKVLRWKIVAGRQAYRESLKYWYLFCVWKSRFWGNVPRLFKLKRISFFEGHNDRLFPRSTGKRTRSNWLYFQARY